MYVKCVSVCVIATRQPDSANVMDGEPGRL